MESITILCTGYVIHQTAVRGLAKYACGLPRIPTLELNQASISSPQLLLNDTCIRLTSTISYKS